MEGEHMLSFIISGNFFKRNLLWHSKTGCLRPTQKVKVLLNAMSKGLVLCILRIKASALNTVNNVWNSKGKEECFSETLLVSKVVCLVGWGRSQYMYLTWSRHNEWHRWMIQWPIKIYLSTIIVKGYPWGGTLVITSLMSGLLVESELTHHHVGHGRGKGQPFIFTPCLYDLFHGRIGSKVREWDLQCHLKKFDPSL